MFSLKEFVKNNLIQGVINGSFGAEYARIMGVNYLIKGILTEEDLQQIDKQAIYIPPQPPVLEEETPEEELFLEEELSEESKG